MAGYENGDISGAGMIDNMNTSFGRSCAFSDWDNISKSEDICPCRNSNVKEILQRKDEQKEVEMIVNLYTLL